MERKNSSFVKSYKFLADSSRDLRVVVVGSMIKACSVMKSTIVEDKCQGHRQRVENHRCSSIWR
jgi:hypothetical protein